MGSSCLLRGVGILLLAVVIAELTVAETQCPSIDPKCVCNFDAQDILTSVECHGLGQRDTLPSFNATTMIIPTVRIEGAVIYRLHNDAFKGLRIRNLLLNDLHISILEPFALRGLKPYLESLELNSNGFASLSEELFSNFDSLKTITLNRNRLEQVKATWFAGIPSLQYLSLSNNMIRDIELGSFDSLSKLTTLYLTENKLTYLNSLLFYRLAKLRTLWLVSNNITVLPVNLFNTLGELEWLDLSHNQLTMLPDGIFRGTHSLKRLYASSNLIQEVSPNNLPTIRTLEILVLSNNNISVLRDSTLTNVVNLKRLALDSNRIRKLTELIFENLQELTTLELHNNEIQELPPNILVGLLQLKKLTLQNNKIKVLTYGVFDPLGRLISLDISHNLLEVVEFGPFDALRNLLYLNMSNNFISKVEVNWFRKAGALIELRLNHNTIRSIERNSFAKLPHLEELYLEHNYIQVIEPNMLFMSKEIRLLSLHHNPLKTIATGSFGSVNHLVNLYLNYTCIKELPMNFFANFTALRELRLDHTPIEVIKSYSFEPLKNLQTLILGHHNLTLIEPRPLSFVRNITHFSADNMRLSVNDLANLLVDLPNVQQLSLKYNLLISLQQSTFSKNSKLQQLSVVGNPLVCDCHLGWLRTFASLIDIEDTACAGSGNNTIKLAACFPLPQRCGNIESLPKVTDKCQLPPSVSSQGMELDYSHCVVPPELTTPLPTTIRTTPSTTLGPVHISITTNHSEVLVTWDIDTNPGIHGFRVRYRVFANNTWRYSHDVEPNVTVYAISDMVAGKRYFVCVDVIVKTGDKYIKNEAACQEIDFNYRVTTVAPIQEVVAKKQLPLLVIVGASAAVIIVIFVIIIVLVCCLRKTKTRFTENAQRREDHDRMVKDKMGMWVTSFSYDGDVQESMSEQMMLDYDIFSGNNPTVSKARYAQMLAHKDIVIPDVLVVGDGGGASTQVFQMADKKEKDKSHHTDIRHVESLGDVSRSDPGYGESDPGYGESEAGYTGSDILQGGYSEENDM